MNQPKLIFLVTEDWYFMSHRFELACAAQRAGYDVSVITQVGEHGDVIRAAGLTLYPIQFSRSLNRPLQDLKTLAAIFLLYRKIRPDLVHHVALKPVLFGGLVARFSKRITVINALTGLGYVFASEQRKARVLRSVISRAFRSLFKQSNAWLILQNADDQKMLIEEHIAQQNRTIMIKGSGIDTMRFQPMTPTNDENSDDEDDIVVMLAARMLWDKGVGEFVEAAKRVLHRHPNVKFVLVGESDPENPAAIPDETLRAWQADGVITWLGKRNDMPAILQKATIFCLPSYREGLPKVLLEAAACGAALITTDAPGCREVVTDNVTGLLIPIKEVDPLVTAIECLITDSDLRQRLANSARARVKAAFSIEQVINETLSLYETALSTSAQGELKS